ncbi:MAG: 50S ribosomal protein L30 [Armatimonadetes bacterium]|nr:50S ribosomal protein L30 [Armatimonadota bacterium]
MMLKVTLIKSVIGYDKRQKATVSALGLGKVGSSALHGDNACVMGMIRKVGHLLEVEHLSDPVEVTNEA